MMTAPSRLPVHTWDLYTAAQRTEEPTECASVVPTRCCCIARAILDSLLLGPSLVERGVNMGGATVEASTLHKQRTS